MTELLENFESQIHHQSKTIFNKEATNLEGYKDASKNIKKIISPEISGTSLNRIINLDFKCSQEGGKMGLKNLGNTCYMNSALQCLANTKELVNYFFSEEYTRDINNEYNLQINLNGSDDISSFTNLFSKFINENWSINKMDKTKDPINPQELRSKFLKICPQFDNTYQHDAHEVLTLILDTLNQGLNRKKDDGILSLSLSLSRNFSYWENHTPSTCGDSIITDLFFGNLKSTIKCINCNEAYSKIDPFDNLGLPIPYEYKILVYFIPIKKNSKPIKIFIKINDNMQFKDVEESVKELLQVDYKFNSGIFYWVLNNKFLSLIDKDERCGDLLSRSAFLFLIENDNLIVEDVIDRKIGAANMDTYKWVNNKMTNRNNFYVCINFLMFGEYSNESYSSQENLKNSSYPRIFSFSFTDDFEIDDKKIIMAIFDTLINYIKNFIQSPDDFKDFQNNKLIILLAKSLENIYYNEDSRDGDNKQNEFKAECDKNFTCLFCGTERKESFYCDCFNKLSPKKSEYIFYNNDDINSSLIYYIKNRKNNSDLILDFNINISVDILKYRELNRCKDSTQKIIPETKLDLIGLLKYFTAEEKLTLQDNYFCHNCNKNVIAYKKMEINKFPHILIFNLKRFRFETSNFGKNRSSRRSENNVIHMNSVGEKNENKIDFPLNTLDLSEFTNEKTEYELFAVINHNGKLDSGHYTAICRHPSSKLWNEYDDRHVKSKSIEQICTNNAYVLFYRKKDKK
jgi:ubiquitin carboxyl-terminal hydrolase 4/11/15